jgi:hypothetical protein
MDRVEMTQEAAGGSAVVGFWASAKAQAACKKSGKNRVFFNIVIDIPRRRI